MSNHLFTSDAEGVTRPATPNEILAAARGVLSRRVRRGTIDGASVYPREVIKEALSRNPTAVILAHNHPSGVAEPSQADALIRNRLHDASAHIDVRVLDPLVVTGDRPSYIPRFPPYRHSGRLRQRAQGSQAAGGPVGDHRGGVPRHGE